MRSTAEQRKSKPWEFCQEQKHDMSVVYRVLK